MNNEISLQDIKPFFVIGNPRSGTTLLRLMLNRHEEIVVPPECGFSVWLSDSFSQRDFTIPEAGKEFVSQVVRSRKFETWGLDENEIIQFVHRQQPTTYREAVLAIYLFYALKQGRTPNWIGDKNNHYIKQLDVLEEIFNSPRYVFIVRDGLDVACSYRALQALRSDSIYSPRLPNSIDEIAREWGDNNAKVITYLQKYPERCVLTRYEDLIVNPEHELIKICNFFDVKYMPTMLTYYENNDEPHEFLNWKEKVVQPPDQDNFGMYKKILSIGEIETFEKIARKTLDYFHYPRRGMDGTS
jgi:hypothetical protein